MMQQVDAVSTHISSVCASSSFSSSSLSLCFSLSRSLSVRERARARACVCVCVKVVDGGWVKERAHAPDVLFSYI